MLTWSDLARFAVGAIKEVIVEGIEHLSHLFKKYDKQVAELIKSETEESEGESDQQ